MKLVTFFIAISFSLLLSETFAETPPDIEVSGNGIVILNGDTSPTTADGTDYGAISIGGPLTEEFSITNRGNNDLILTDNPIVQIIGSSTFTVISQPAFSTVAKNNSVTFMVQFLPDSSGNHNATVSIASNDSDDNPYTFSITGTGLGVPEITVLGNGIEITNGDTTPDTSDDTDFAGVDVYTSSTKTFTIQNTGDGVLTIISDITVSDTTNFSVTSQPSSPVTAGGTTTFDIEFHPESGMEYTTTVTIPNDDSDENPYTFSIKGTGIVVPPTISSPTVSNTDISTAELGATITHNGGDPALTCGTVWAETSSPTTNAMSSGVCNLSTPFSHTRVSLPPAGTLIYYRGYATNSAGTGYSPDGSFYTESYQASNVQISAVTYESMTVTWSNDSTSSGALVVISASSPPASPVDGDEHSGDPDLADGGTEISVGTFVVYSGPGTSVDITGLASGTTYYVQVFAYVGSGSLINYQQDSPPHGSATTLLPPPTLSSPTAQNIQDTQADLGATINSNGGVPITDYGAYWNAVSPAENGTKCSATGDPESSGFPYVYSGTCGGLSPATHYVYAGYADNSSAVGYSPEGSFYTEPDQQATDLTFTNVGINSMTINWNPNLGSGTAEEGVLVMIDEIYDVTPPDDGNLYTASPMVSNFEDIPGVHDDVVYIGQGTSVDVISLCPGKQYNVKVFKYAGTGAISGYDQGINYETDSALSGSWSTLSNEPLLQASNLIFNGIDILSWTPGSGNGAVVYIRKHGEQWNMVPEDCEVNRPLVTNAEVYLDLEDDMTYYAAVYEYVDLGPMQTKLWPWDITSINFRRNIDYLQNNPAVLVFSTKHPSPDPTASCEACHLSPQGGSDRDDYLWDGTPSAIDQGEWLSSGHGSTSQYNSGNAAAGFGDEGGGCLYCHDNNIRHNQPGNFFRLRDHGIGPWGNWGPYNGVCLICHETGLVEGFTPAGYSSGRDASAEVDPLSHYGDKHGNNNSGGDLCWDCHDPHGDLSDGSSGNTRWFMIQKNPVMNRDDTTQIPTSFASDTWFRFNIPHLPALTDYTENGGVCVNCHTSTDHYPGVINLNHPLDDYGENVACTECHKHNYGWNRSIQFPEALSVSNHTAIRSGTLTPGETGVAMQSFQVDCGSVLEEYCVLNAITIDDTGSAGYADWVNVKIYLDTSLAAELPSWEGTPVTLPLARTTVNNGTPVNVTVYYDIGQIIGGTTFQSVVTAVGVEFPDAGATGLSYSSNLLTVDDCPSDQAKTAPGLCGCGKYEIDSDGDGSFCCGDAPDDTTPDCDGYMLDCDDSDPASYPEFEICDGIDNDCNGVIHLDEIDNDADGFVECTIDAGGWSGDPSVTGGDDCVDYDSLLNPESVWYQDSDNDGYGDPSVAYPECWPPEGTVLDDTDCDDSDPILYPGGPPVRLQGPLVYYDSLQSGFDNVPFSSGTIEVKNVTLTEDLDFSGGSSSIFRGGYDCAFTSASGTTTVIGDMVISLGELTIESGTLKIGVLP